MSDLRVQKTLAAIRKTFEKMLLEKDYDKITVTELCKRAQINQKTFYRYYETLDFLTTEITDEFLNGYMRRIENYSLPEDLTEINREFFTYSAEQGTLYEKIICAASYRQIGGKMIGKTVKAAWTNSAAYQSLDEHEQKILLTFIYNVGLEFYRRWI